MNKKFTAELGKLTDVEFFVLEHHINISRMVRDTMSKNNIDDKTMAARLGVPIKKMRSVLTGAYEFDLRLLASLQAFTMELSMEAGRLKIESESIGFAAYKDQYPVVIRKIDELLKHLQQPTTPKP